MNEILDALDSLRAVSGTNAKKKILQDTKSELFAEIFKLAYDPFITFGVHKIDISDVEYADAVADNWIDRAFELLQLLKTRHLTGNAAKNAVKDVMHESTLRHAELIMNILNKDLRIGAGIRVINSVYENLLPEDFCMAAMKYDPKRITFPVYADTKLDGVRCIAVIDDTITLFSRNGKEFKNYGTISKELELLDLPKGTRLDGEITMGHFQDLMRTVSRKDDGIELAKDAVYNVFDVQHMDETLDARQAFLAILLLDISKKNLSHIKIVLGNTINNEEGLIEYYSQTLAEGFEGIMIKPYSGKYEMKRSYAWQKMKPEITEDLYVIGVEEGTGKYVGQLGKLVCRLENGGEVRVGSGFTDKEREELALEGENVIGRMIEVKCQEKTRDGSLRFPVFMRFRPDKE